MNNSSQHLFIHIMQNNLEKTSKTGANYYIKSKPKYHEQNIKKAHQLI